MKNAELIQILQGLNPDHPVMIRTPAGALISIDQATTERDTFETRIEIA